MDEWQRLKAVAIELTRLTGPSQCACSQCEMSLMPAMASTWLDPVGQAHQRSIEPSDERLLDVSAERPTGGPTGGLASPSLEGWSDSATASPYQRLGEAVRRIVERSSVESSTVLARHAWCQDATLYHVWHNIQQSHAESLPLLVRSLCAESSASLAAAAAAASPVGRRFRKDVQQLLEKAFQCKPWPNPVEKTMLARRCGLTVRQVGVWFSNRRARCWSVPSPQPLVKS